MDGSAELKAKKCDKEDVPVYIGVMMETEEEMRNIESDELRLKIYIARILIYTYERYPNNYKIREQYLEAGSDLYYNFSYNNGFLLPYLMMYVTRYKHEGSLHSFDWGMRLIVAEIKKVGFDNDAYVWILELLKEMAHRIVLNATVTADIPKWADTPRVLKLRLVQFVDAVLVHKSAPCPEMISILRNIINTEEQQQNSIGLLHAVVRAFPIIKIDTVKLFLSLKASVNRLDKYDATPIYHLAEFCGWPKYTDSTTREERLELFDLLIQHGAQIDYCSTEGLTALDKIRANMMDMCPVKNQTLQCLAARAIHHVANFNEEDIPWHLREFVKRRNPIFREKVNFNYK